MLLEVLAAVTLLSTAALALLALLQGQTAAATQGETREREVAAEQRLLSAHALLSRVDLNRRLGVRTSDSFVVTVSRPTQSLYRVAVSRASFPDVEDLVTVLFRPDTFRAP